jgi:TetR/AcrR family transcriptional regulator, transcriptional repressor for nem operon
MAGLNEGSLRESAIVSKTCSSGAAMRREPRHHAIGGLRVDTGSHRGDDWSIREYNSAMQTKETDNRQSILDTAERIMAHKGYAAVGLNEVLAEAGVPKGSFYHWFASKDAFGEALIENYFAGYLPMMDRIHAEPTTASERLTKYWQSFYDMQSFDECQGKCLVVKLGAEASDLSESMRLALIEGTKGIVARIERMIRDGLADGSVSIDAGPRDLALDLYTGWIGASVLAKINRGPESLDRVMAMTLQRLHIA